MFGAPINSVIIAALAAIAGSLVGAFGSAVGTWITARHQDRRDLLGKQIARREALYSDFIGESERLLVDAMQHNVSDLQKLLPVYALLSPHSAQFFGARSANSRKGHKNYCEHLPAAQPDG